MILKFNKLLEATFFLEHSGSQFTCEEYKGYNPHIHTYAVSKMATHCTNPLVSKEEPRPLSVQVLLNGLVTKVDC